MDPDKALDNMITAVLDGDFEEAASILDDLRMWCGRYGYAPLDPRRVEGSASGASGASGAGWLGERD